MDQHTGGKKNDKKGRNIQGWACAFAEPELLNYREHKRVFQNERNGHKSHNNNHNYYDENHDKIGLYQGNSKRQHQNSAQLSFPNALCPCDATCWHSSGPSLVQVMACCMTALSHYLNKILTSHLTDPHESNFTAHAQVDIRYNEFE